MKYHIFLRSVSSGLDEETDWEKLVKKLIISFLLVFFNYQAIAKHCTNLEFIPVDIVENPNPQKIPCDKKIDRMKCLIQEGSGKIKITNPAGKAEIHFLKRMDRRELSIESLLVLDILKHSKIIAEVNRLKILGRKISGHKDVCEENLIYVGSKKILGLGTLFVPGGYFYLTDYSKKSGKSFSNMIFSEDGQMGKFIKTMSNSALLDKGVFEITIAHELAHGLMQDLYGVENMTKLVLKSESKEFHDVSVVTDPYMAFYEGFAIGVESYLRKKFPENFDEVNTPFLKDFFEEFQGMTDSFDNNIALYIGDAVTTIPKLLYKNITQADQFVGELLNASRGQAVFENRYIRKGQWINLINRFKVVYHPGISVVDMTQINSGQYETANDAVYSKEGIVAHIFYWLLNNGFEEDIFMTMASFQSQNIFEFYQNFESFISKFQEKEFPTDVFFRTLVDQGRKAHNLCLRESNNFSYLSLPYMKSFDENCDGLQEKYYLWRMSEQYTRKGSQVPEKFSTFGKYKIHLLKKTAYPLSSPLFIEFESGDFIRRKFVGYLDRINLKSVTPARFTEYLKSINRNDHAASLEVLSKKVDPGVIDEAVWAFFGVQNNIDFTDQKNFTRNDLSINSIVGMYRYISKSYFKKYQKTKDMEYYKNVMFFNGLAKSIKNDRVSYLEKRLRK
jgi:hypothetical protein